MNALLLILIIGSVPHNLSTDLLTDTRSVYKGGYHTSATLSQVQESWRRGQTDYFQVSTINSEHPYLAWELPEGLSGQKAYRILMASKTELLSEGKADVWDSGDVEDGQTTGIVCSGKALQPSTVYYWTVRVTDPDGKISGYARPQQFLTARKLDAANQSKYGDQYVHTRALFSQGHFLFVEASMGGALRDFEEMPKGAGVVMNPKYDSNQPDYYHKIDKNAIIWAIPKDPTASTDMLTNILGLLGKEGANIENMVNKSRKDMSVTVMEMAELPSKHALDTLSEMQGIIRIRTFSN